MVDYLKYFSSLKYKVKIPGYKSTIKKESNNTGISN